MTVTKNPILWLLLAGFAAHPAMAGRATLESSGCDEALKNHYGDQATFRLVDRRNTKEGLLIKAAVRNVSTSSGNWESHYSTCLVKRGSGDLQIEETARAGKSEN